MYLGNDIYSFIQTTQLRVRMTFWCFFLPSQQQQNVESELRMIPERSDVVLLNLEKNLEVMTPTQRKLMSVYLNNNNTNTNTSNNTISDAERADYQMQLWVWVIGIVCVILAVWAVTLIDYSGDQMLYALEMTKSHHD